MITQKSEQHPKTGLCTKHTVDNTDDGVIEAGVWVFVSPLSVGVNLVVVSGSAKVEFTAALPSECQTNQAIAFDWDQGTQTGAGKKSSVLNGATAVRVSALAVGTIASMTVRSLL